MKTGTTKIEQSKRAQLVSRDAILALLSDEEAARVSSAEGRNDLRVGDEYIDLQHLDQGVQQAFWPTKHEGNLLPRTAVLAATWQKIQAQMLAP
ncbi:MAG: hypothetical protein ABIY55_28285 [Kofleriaceae bacterium]